jgi:hypothetical protein
LRPYRKHKQSLLLSKKTKNAIDCEVLLKRLVLVSILLCTTTLLSIGNYFNYMCVVKVFYLIFLFLELRFFCLEYCLKYFFNLCGKNFTKMSFSETCSTSSGNQCSGPCIPAVDGRYACQILHLFWLRIATDRTVYWEECKKIVL